MLLLGMSYDNTLNNILNTLVTCYWELPWANTLNNVTNSLKNRNSYARIYCGKLICNCTYYDAIFVDMWSHKYLFT